VLSQQLNDYRKLESEAKMIVTPEQLVESLITLSENLIGNLREFGSIEDANDGEQQLTEIKKQYVTMTQ
jgi:hypothetical protein